MDGTAIYNRSLRLSHTNANDYTTAQATEDMELRHQDLVDRIVVVTKGDYFWDTWISDTVIGQSEYVADKLWISPDDLDIKKINKVFIKYNDWDAYYTPVRFQNPATLDEHPDYYSDNQPTVDPFFYIQDESIFIYPAPSAAITGGLQLYCIHKPTAITTSSTEASIEIPTQFHKLIVLGLVADVYYSQGKINEANDAEAKYEAGILDMVAFMKQRYNQPKKKTQSGLDFYR